VPVAFAVGAEGCVVIHAARHEGEVAWGDFSPRCFFEIHDAERLFGISHDRGNLGCALR
jgi:hypothetical protein